MTSAFAASLILAAIVFVSIVWLLWRARSIRGASAAMQAGAARIRRWRWVDLRNRLRRGYQAIDRAVRYVMARRDWRYCSSWVLLTGFPGDGKSSIAASVPERLQRASQRRDAKHEAYLRNAARDAQWHFLEKGILLDPACTIGEPSSTGGSDARWPAMLADIDSLRPDRALDGIVWVISAARLLEAGEAQCAELGRHAFARINELQETFAFALPVYVVVSQCDAVQGFSAFWMAQDPDLRGEMAGWSSPSIDDNGLPSEWVGKAFDKLMDGLRALVLNAATVRDEIRDVDDFFLFPSYMGTLRAPVQAFLEKLFRPNAYETRAFCRGIYFTGVVSDGGTGEAKARSGAGTGAAMAAAGGIRPDAGAPRGDVAFVGGLMEDKVFAEQRLAQRLQKGLLARNRLIRRLQIGLIAIAASLAVALPWSAAQVSQRAQALRDTVVDISVSSKNLSRHGCLDEERVYGLIAQVAALNRRTRYVAIPLSWVDRRIEDGISRVISTNALEQVVLPSLACKLQQRIDAMSAATLNVATMQSAPDAAYAKDRRQLQRQLADLGTLEDNLDRFAAIAKPGLQVEKRRLLQYFGALAEYVYGNPLPPHALKGDAALTDALVEATYSEVPTIDQALRTQLTERFDTMAARAQADLLQRIGIGVPLLKSLQEAADSSPLTSSQQARPPILPLLRSFNGWLAWVRNAWLRSTPAGNPCLRMGERIKPGIEALINAHHFPAGLRATLEHFNTEECYQPVVDSLRDATLPPYGALFSVNPSNAELDGITPDLGIEAAGLKALAGVDYMQVKPTLAYSCSNAAAGWRANTFGQALSEIRQYQAFAGQQGTILPGSPPAKERLYDQLARTQLLLALQDSLARNQRTQVGDAGDTGLDATSQLDRELSAESANLSAALGPLLQSLRSFRQLGFADLAGEVGQCAQNYASSMLADVSDLASSSHLYDPPVQAATDGKTAIFNLGTVPVLQAYLGNQLARVQVLSGYAAPFVTLLKGSSGVNNSQRSNTQTDVYWGNTISELNRAVQFADPAGQVGQLNDFFLKQLAAMNYANCTGMLGGYPAPAIGNDLFSQRRAAMAQLAQAACADHGQADSSLHFVRIGMLFNSQLAGRYPFGPDHSREVSPAIVKAFFMYYAKEKPELETWLATAKGDKAAQMKAFIERLDAVQSFFAGNLLAMPKSAPIALDVGFRALPANSPISNQLIAWTVRSGDDSIAWPGSATGVSWNFGEPVSFDMQWADRSRFVPLPDPAQPDLSVSGYHATFEGGGSWALLRLIDRHSTNAAAADALDPDLQLLQFRLPVQAKADTARSQSHAGEAGLYLTLRLSAPDPASKAIVPLAVPAFPREAPVLW
ncbi:MAG: hypothetical protein KGJ32_01475 [Xanthomonadaceae bacterium]|nr:hypothetical protein [Xanthomonadaceae bacterium]